MIDAPFTGDDNPLEIGWRAKLARAAEHLQVLDEQIRLFLAEQEPYGLTTEQNSWDDGEKRGIEVIFRADIRQKIDIRWSVTVGEFLYNARSALDHLAFALSCRLNQPRPNRAEFPVFLSSKDYRRMDNRSSPPIPTKWSGLYKVRFMSDDVRALIETLQPYNGRGEDSGLWLLESLRNFDTHQNIHIVGAMINDPRLTYSINRRGLQILDISVHSGPFEHGAILASCKIWVREVHLISWTDMFRDGKPDGSPMKVGFNQPFNVAFDQIGPGRGKMIIPCLATIYEDVWMACEALSPYIGKD